MYCNACSEKCGADSFLWWWWASAKEEWGGGSAQEQAYRLGMGVTTRGFAWARPGRGGRVGMGVAE